MKELPNKSSLYVAGCGLLVIVGIGFGILPLNRSLADVKNQAQQKLAQASSLEKKISVLKSIQKGLDADAKRKQQLEIAAPPDIKIDEVFIMLESMAIEAGLAIDNISPAQGDKAASGGLNDITVTLKGEFDNLVNFSKLVKGNLRPMFVKSVTFAAQESKDGKTTLSATFALQLLTAGQSNAQAPSVPGTVPSSGTVPTTTLGM